jgi:ABC-type multidrug transport system fused ATPase/permease subunit
MNAKNVLDPPVQKWKVAEELDVFLQFKRKDMEERIQNLIGDKPKKKGILPNHLLLLVSAKLALVNIYFTFFNSSWDYSLALRFVSLLPIIYIFFQETSIPTIILSLANTLWAFRICSTDPSQTFWRTLNILAALAFLYYNYELKLLKLNSFFNELNFQHFLKEREQAEAKEMRAAIGNIAHDLKTVRKYFSILLFFSDS